MRYIWMNWIRSTSIQNSIRNRDWAQRLMLRMYRKHWKNIRRSARWWLCHRHMMVWCRTSKRLQRLCMQKGVRWSWMKHTVRISDLIRISQRVRIYMVRIWWSTVFIRRFRRWHRRRFCMWTGTWWSEEKWNSIWICYRRAVRRIYWWRVSMRVSECWKRHLKRIRMQDQIINIKIFFLSMPIALKHFAKIWNGLSIWKLSRLIIQTAMTDPNSWSP